MICFILSYGSKKTEFQTSLKRRLKVVNNSTEESLDRDVNSRGKLHSSCGGGEMALSLLEALMALAVLQMHLPCIYHKLLEQLVIPLG